MTALVELGIVLVIGLVALLAGIRIGLVVAPRLGRALDGEAPGEGSDDGLD